MWYKQFSVIKPQDVPIDFINLNQLNITISTQQMDENKPLFLSVDENVNNSSTLSNVCIDQENDKNEIKHIAYFYKSYDYTHAFRLMLNDQQNLEYYKLYITGVNIPDNDQIKMIVNFFIKSSYLLKLYEQAKVPLMIYKLIITEGIVNDGQYKPEIETCERNSTSLGNLQLKRQPFDYQVENIKWMENIEENVKHNKLHYETFMKPLNSVYYNIESINELFLLDRTDSKMVNISTLETSKFDFKGGILADDIGLGKTLSVIGLVVLTKNVNSQPTLVICPKRLSKQWEYEIEKSCELKVNIINTIAQFKKMTSDSVNNFDIIISSYEFLGGKKYNEVLGDTTNNNSFTFHNYNWERVVLDEGHEYITNSININKIHYRNVLQSLYKIQSKYKWVVSGTPFNNRLDFWEIVSYLTSEHDCIDLSRYSYKENIRLYNKIFNKNHQHCIHELISLFIRKNTKESVTNEVYIPDYNINTIFLNMTTIERAIYNSALNNDIKKQELCNHVLVSESHINILGNDPISMEDTRTKMITYYNKKVTYQEKRIENITTQISEFFKRNGINEESKEDENTVEDAYALELLDELKQKKIEISDELKDNIRKKEIFDELEQKLKEEECCPICYEEFGNLYKAVTPCGHFICSDCIQQLSRNNSSIKCPICRNIVNHKDLEIISPTKSNITSQLGTKMSKLIEYSTNIINKNDSNRIIVFSQWDSMLKLISKNLNTGGVNHILLNGSYHTLNNKIRKFKLDNSIRILLLSSEKAGSGLTLTEASHIILMDTMTKDQETTLTIERQAIGRSVRIGQEKTVEVVRFIMKDSIEEQYYNLI